MKAYINDEILNKEIKGLLGSICGTNEPKHEVNTVCIDYKTKRIYTTDTRELIIVNMSIDSELEDTYYIDKDTFNNSSIGIFENGVFIGNNKIYPITNNTKTFTYPDIDRVVPDDFQHIYKITGYMEMNIHHILVKHKICYNANFIHNFCSVFKNENICYLKFNSNEEPVVITIEKDKKEFIKYLFMPITMFDMDKTFRKIGKNLISTENTSKKIKK